MVQGTKCASFKKIYTVEKYFGYVILLLDIYY